MNVVEAWRVRRALNCLTNEVQRYVNCDIVSRKLRLKQEFHLLFDKII